jgi:hypothetical protein
LKTIELGYTEVPQDIFHGFLDDIKDRFTIDTYDLFTHNCNNFTDECANFLIGEGIPAFITGLPNEVL